MRPLLFRSTLHERIGKRLELILKSTFVSQPKARRHGQIGRFSKVAATRPRG